MVQGSDMWKTVLWFMSSEKSMETMPFGKYDCLVMLEDVCVVIFAVDAKRNPKVKYVPFKTVVKTNNIKMFLCVFAALQLWEKACFQRT